MTARLVHTIIGPAKRVLRHNALTGTIYGIQQLLFSRKSYLRRLGWWSSFRAKSPVDSRGLPIPWLSYPAIEFLVARIQPEWCVFEYGSGNSTLWWAARVSNVVSCEHDSEWASFVEANRPENVTLLVKTVEDGSYAAAIQPYEECFDVVVVDGECRRDCVPFIERALNPGGFIVFDNTDRPKNQPATKQLEESGFKRVDFIGQVPGSVHTDATSVFYRANNCIGL